MSGINTAGAAAYQRLRPNNPLNIGAIVENHIRYWRKYDDDKAAKEKARRAREAQTIAKQNQEAWKLYSGLSPEENQGFLNNQIIDVFEKNKSQYAELAKKAAAGDIDSKLKLEDVKRKFTALTNANKIYGEKAVALEKQKAEGNFNEFLDTPIEDFKNALGKGMYKLNDDLTLDMYDPTSGELKRVGAQTLLSNEYLNSSFNKKPEFQENGGKIAKTLLDTNDGQKLIEADTRTKGIRLVKNLFAQDDIEAISWYGSFMKETGVDPLRQKPFSQLSDIEKNIIAESYYDKNVLPRIQQVTVDTTLDDANKAAALASKRLDIKRKKQALRKAQNENKSSIITVATNEQGEILRGLRAEYPTTAISDDSEIYIVGNNGVSFRDVKTDKETETTLTNLVIEDGNVIGLAKTVEKTPILDEEGDPIPGRFEEVVVDDVITDKNELNKFATKIDKETGGKHKNLKELVSSMRKAREEVQPKVELTREITNQNTPQETREQRIARMRAVITGN